MSADIVPFGIPRPDGPVKAPRASRQHEPVDREIARLREIVAQTGDALLLAEGPVSPDAQLLELCDEAASSPYDRRKGESAPMGDARPAMDR
jgi:hypothetical protein